MKSVNTFVYIISAVLVVGISAMIYFIVTKPASNQLDNEIIGQYNLRVTTTIWSGWGKGSSSSKIKNFDLEKITKITVDDIVVGKTIDFEIESYDTNSGTIRASGLGLKQVDDVDSPGIDLEGCGEQNFAINKGERAELYSCTMDAGISYLIEY